MSFADELRMYSPESEAEEQSRITREAKNRIMRDLAHDVAEAIKTSSVPAAKKGHHILSGYIIIDHYDDWNYYVMDKFDYNMGKHKNYWVHIVDRFDRDHSKLCFVPIVALDGEGIVIDKNSRWENAMKSYSDLFSSEEVYLLCKTVEDGLRTLGFSTCFVEAVSLDFYSGTEKEKMTWFGSKMVLKKTKLGEGKVLKIKVSW